MKTGRRSPRWQNFFFRGNSVNAAIVPIHETYIFGQETRWLSKPVFNACFLAYFYGLFLLGHYLRCDFFNHRYVFKMNRNIAAIK
jgi:hypothetical protein